MLTTGFIYRIVDNNNGDTYFGSTLDYKRRIMLHENSHNKCSSRKIIDGGNYTAEVVEEVAFTKSRVLLCKEAWYILNFPCVNIRVPNRGNRQSRREYHRMYYQKKKEEKKQAQRERERAMLHLKAKLLYCILFLADEP